MYVYNHFYPLLICKTVKVPRSAFADMYEQKMALYDFRCVLKICIYSVYISKKTYLFGAEVRCIIILL